MSNIYFCWGAAGNYDMIDISNYTITATSCDRERELYQEHLPMVNLSSVNTITWKMLLKGNIVDSDVTLAEYLSTNHPEFLL